MWNNEFGRKVDLLHKDGKINTRQILTTIDQAIRDGGLIKYKDDPRIPKWLKDKLYPPGSFAYGDLQSVPDPKVLDNAHCFLAGTEIDMWPVEAVGLVPDKNGKFDQDKVRAAIWKKPIEQIATGDWVVSFSDDGLLIPGKVGQTFQNCSKHILDVPVPQFDDAGEPNGLVKSLMITPGHVTLCAEVEGEENPFAGQYVPIMDILRSDGALKMQDDTLVRAATGAIVGSEDDKQVWTHVFDKATDGSMKPIEKWQCCSFKWPMPRNIPLSMRGTDGEKTHIAPPEVKPAQHTMSRKQRRAHEARLRKEAKSSKRNLASVH